MRHEVIVLILLTSLVTQAYAQPGGGKEESAWEVLMREDPDPENDRTTPLERRILHALSPEQAEAFAAGADPRTLVLSSGQTLAEYLTSLKVLTSGLVYSPVDSCTVLRTGQSVDGPLTGSPIRDLNVRGETIDLSSQGGSATGCGIPADAEAVLINSLIVSTGGTGKLRAWAWDSPEPTDGLIEYKSTAEDYRPTNASILALCTAGPCSADFKARVAGAAANVRMEVLGYFTPAPDGHSLDAADGDPVDAVTVDNDGNLQGSGTICDTTACIGEADWSAITNKPTTFPPSGIRSGDFDIFGRLDVREDVSFRKDLRVIGGSENQFFLGDSGLITMEAFTQDSGTIEVKGYDSGAARTGVEIQADDKGGELTLFDGNPLTVPNTINQTVFLDGRAGSRGGRVVVRDGLNSDEVIQLNGYDTGDGLNIPMIRVLGGGISVERDGGSGGFLEADSVILNGFLKLALTSGSPSSSQCSLSSHRGRMTFDAATGTLYLCGLAGWVSK